MKNKIKQDSYPEFISLHDIISALLERKTHFIIIFAFFLSMGGVYLLCFRNLPITYQQGVQGAYFNTYTSAAKNPLFSSSQFQGIVKASVLPKLYSSLDPKSSIKFKMKDLIFKKYDFKAEDQPLDQLIDNNFNLIVSGKDLTPPNAKALLTKFISAIKAAQLTYTNNWIKNQHYNFDKIAKELVLVNEQKKLLNDQLITLLSHQQKLDKMFGATLINDNNKIMYDDVTSNLLAVSLEQSKILVNNSVAYAGIQIQKQNQIEALKTKIWELKLQQQPINLSLKSLSPTATITQVSIVKYKSKLLMFIILYILMSLIVSIVITFISRYYLVLAD